MKLPAVQLLGDTKLPKGWRRPTRGLVQAYRRELSEGLAPPSSPHLYTEASPATMGDLKNERTHRGIQLLGEYTRRSSKSSLTAVGMAYPQLARASDRNIRALAVQMGMTDARKESRTDNVHTLINPTYQPLKSSGRVVRLEICFSTPGIGLQILRWQQIMLHIPGKRSRMLDDNDSWYVQHEGDHLDGTLNTDVARQQRRPLYYVPPEWKDPFFRGGFTPAWPTFPFSQYDAMKTGEFDLADYFRFL